MKRYHWKEHIFWKHFLFNYLASVLMPLISISLILCIYTVSLCQMTCNFHKYMTLKGLYFKSVSQLHTSSKKRHLQTQLKLFNYLPQCCLIEFAFAKLRKGMMFWYRVSCTDDHRLRNQKTKVDLSLFIQKLWTELCNTKTSATNIITFSQKKALW